MTSAPRSSLLLMCALAACESTTAPSFPSSAVRYNPPSVYREWWSMTEACSGRSGSFDTISWYVVPGVSHVPGTSFNAEWFPAGNRIVVAGAEEGVSSGELIRHEMLHALLKQGSHPRGVFVGRCGGVVVCIDECLREAEPPPANPAALLEPPESLVVTVEVRPSAPSSSTWDGYFMMFIRARNPANHPVEIEMPPSTFPGVQVTSDYLLSAPGIGTVQYNIPISTPEGIRFDAGETKEVVFDFHNVSGPYTYDKPPGTWTFRGSYAGVWAAMPPTVTVGP